MGRVWKCQHRGRLEGEGARVVLGKGIVEQSVVVLMLQGWIRKWRKQSY